MHNFFEAKDRKLDARRTKSGQRGFGEAAVSSPPHQLLGVCGSAVSSLATNAIWCILSFRIASAPF